MALLEVTDLHTYYGNIHALKGVTLSVEQGEIVTLIGANGAGKSTTLNTISGIVRARTGQVRLAGEENLRMGGYLLTNEVDVRTGIERAYVMFPRLRDRRVQVAGTLSGGEQQMLAMGRALMTNPRVLLLDEPSMGLAPVLVDLIFETIVRLHGDGTTILLVEQNARMALQIADRGYVIETGQIVLTDRAANLRDNEMVRNAYLGIA